jgi:hypothetical protein
VEKRRAKEKTQKIRDMVNERDDLQEKLGEVAAKANKVHVSLNYEAKQSIAASTKLDKQLGDETFRKAMDQIYERFRECFLMVRRKEEFGQFERDMTARLQELTCRVVDIRTTLIDESWTKFLFKRVPS